jgi:hypothetical protein
MACRPMSSSRGITRCKGAGFRITKLQHYRYSSPKEAETT